MSAVEGIILSSSYHHIIIISIIISSYYHHIDHPIILSSSIEKYRFLICFVCFFFGLACGETCGTPPACSPHALACRSAIPLVPLWPGPPLNRVPGSTAQRSRPTPAVDLGTEGCSRRSRLRLLPTPSAKKIWFGFSPGEI